MSSCDLMWTFGNYSIWPRIQTYLARRRNGATFSHRYDKLQPNETHKVHTTTTGEPVVIKEVFYIEGMRSYIPQCSKDRAGACESLWNSATPITGGGRRIRGNPSAVFEHDSVWALVRARRVLSKNWEGWEKCGLPKTRCGLGYL